MTQKHLLDLERGDIFAAAADGVLQAVYKAEGTVGLADDAVAGVKPTVAESLGGLVGHREIAGGEGELFVGSQNELAGLARLGLVAGLARGRAHDSRRILVPMLPGRCSAVVLPMTKLVSVEP